MPELPEVETIRRHLAPRVERRTIAELDVEDARWCEPLSPGELRDAVEGREVERLGRRGKYLIWELTDEVFLLMHLRMTGTLLLDPAPGVLYRRVRIALSDGHELAFCDPRRFGTGQLVLGAGALEEFFSTRLGIEPLGPELTGQTLRELARGRRAPIKAFLLDQRRVAGVGNIYADEALFRARVHPLRPAGTLTREQYEELAAAVKWVLAAGIDAGGASIDDFRHPDGVQGAFQNGFQVHLRCGEPCVRCGTEIVKFVAAGRGTYCCETCQRRPRGLARATPPAARAAGPSGRPRTSRGSPRSPRRR